VSERCDCERRRGSWSAFAALAATADSRHVGGRRLACQPERPEEGCRPKVCEGAGSPTRQPRWGAYGGVDGTRTRDLRRDRLRALADDGSRSRKIAVGCHTQLTIADVRGRLSGNGLHFLARARRESTPGLRPMRKRLCIVRVGPPSRSAHRRDSIHLNDERLPAAGRQRAEHRVRPVLRHQPTALRHRSRLDFAFDHVRYSRPSMATLFKRREDLVLLAILLLHD